MRIIEEAEVRKLISAKDCVQAMREAFIANAKGECYMPARMLTVQPNSAVFGFMPAYIGKCFGAKVITAYGPNAGTKYPSHIGYVMLFESEHCTVTGLVDATSVTEIRTGAVSALATDMLARKDAHKLALIGAGAQARSHMAAMVTVREITSVTVYDLRKDAAERFAAEMTEKYGVPVTVCASVAECVKGADIVCTLTPAKEAYLTLDMIAPGTHVNAVGTFTKTTREAASDLMAAARVYADQTEACRRESGEYLIPLAEGLYGEDHIVGDLSELVTGKVAGRGSDEEITLFDALGLAIEDIACAQLAMERAEGANA